MKHQCKRCAAKFCNATGKNNPDLKFFAFPKNVEMKLKWIEALEIEDWTSLSKVHHVCAKHFKPEFMLSRYLCRHAIPSLYLNDYFLYEFELENKRIEVKKENTRTYSRSDLSLLKEKECNIEQLQMENLLKMPPNTKTSFIEKTRSPTVTENLQVIEIPKKIKKDKKNQDINLVKFWKKKFSNLKFKYNKLIKLNIELKQKIKITDLNHIIDSSNNADTAKTFAKMILSEKKITEKWGEKEILLATSIFYKSPKMFQYLKALNCRLPSKNTIIKYLPLQHIQEDLYDEQFEVKNEKLENCDDML